MEESGNDDDTQAMRSLVVVATVSEAGCGKNGAQVESFKHPIDSSHQVHSTGY